MSLIISSSDVNKATKEYTPLLSNDKDDSTKLKASVDKFNTESEASGLVGGGYDSARKYLIARYEDLFTTREQIDDQLTEVIKTMNTRMSDYISPDDILDTSKLPELREYKSSIESSISSLNHDIDNYDSKNSRTSLRSLNNELANYRADLKKTCTLIDKLEDLYEKDDAEDMKLDAVRSLISKYASEIDGFESLKGEIKTGGEDGQTGINPEEPGTEPATPATPATPTTTATPTTPTTVEDTTTDAKKLAAAATGLIGMTSAQLAADTSNGVYNTENYEAGQSWNAKFVNDVIRRNQSYTKLLEDYYNNAEEYPDPYNSSSSMLKYAMKEDSNMEFNWSSGSVDTITKYNSDNGYDEVKYTAYTPKEGDVVFFDSETSNGTFAGNTKDVSSVDRVGIVESVSVMKDANGNEKTVITVIEGDCGDNPDTSVVSRRTYEVDSKEILGYGTIKEYDSKTDTSNNHNGTQNGSEVIVEDPTTDEDKTVTTNPEESKEYPINLKEGDSTGNINGDNGGTVDYEGVQRDSNGNEIGNADITNENNETIITEDDIPSKDTEVKEDTPQEPIDMSDYSDKQGEYFDDIDPDMIVWDWKNNNN